LAHQRVAGRNTRIVTRWHFVTGEYPPAPGGVSDYTRQLAAGLAVRGETVEVWARVCGGADPGDPGVRVHRLHSFQVRDLREFDRELGDSGERGRLFVQYVPQAFGVRGMNVPFIRWLTTRRQVDLWVQFHEVAVGWDWLGRPHHQLMSLVQHRMARRLARRAERIFVSVEGWRRRLGSVGERAQWLPIPSNVPTSVSELVVARSRRELGPGPWLGHFGTYGSGIVRDLAPALLELADRNSTVRFLLLGRGATRFGQELGLGERVRFLDDLSAPAVAAHLAACDLLVQPFPDGISARRTSAMAGLALGVPMVTTEGHLTDSIWPGSGAVALAPAGDVATIAGLALDLLEAPEKRMALGRRGADLYRERFALERTMEALGLNADARVDQRP
jgi:glycosyltransferase involved in cell wall biosynthesis